MRMRGGILRAKQSRKTKIDGTDMAVSSCTYCRYLRCKADCLRVKSYRRATEERASVGKAQHDCSAFFVFFTRGKKEGRLHQWPAALQQKVWVYWPPQPAALPPLAQ
jgi:hypothetical protein